MSETIDEMVVRDVQRAAKMMDRHKPGWFRRIVFKRLDMSIPCDCIAGQSGLAWEELDAEYAERYPDLTIAPFADPDTEPAWRDEVRKRRAS